MELVLDRVSKQYGNKIAVDRISTVFRAGVIGLLGANGAGKKIKNYSGGMKQRLGIAQAVLNDPKILVLDEPTAGLDPKERVRFRNLIAELGKDSIVILSTHIVSDVEHIADRILMMKDGQFIYDGTLEGIGMDLEDIHGIRFATEHRQNDLPPLSAGSRQ